METRFYYIQVNENGIPVSFLDTDVEFQGHPEMIKIPNDDHSFYFRSFWNGETWADPAPEGFAYAWNDQLQNHEIFRLIPEEEANLDL